MEVGRGRVGSSTTEDRYLGLARVNVTMFTDGLM
jgi:hypothetical protein